MNEAEARELAERLISELDMKGYEARFAEVRSHARFPEERSVIFDVYSSSGELFGGPMVVIVDERTKEARLLEAL